MHKVKRFSMLVAAGLLSFLAINSFLLLTMARVDDHDEFLMKRSAAYLNVILWPVIIGLFRSSSTLSTESAEPNTWLTQRFGARGASAAETIFVVFVVFLLAWLVSAGSMQGEYNRMAKPEKAYDWLYPLTRI